MQTLGTAAKKLRELEPELKLMAIVLASWIIPPLIWRFEQVSFLIVPAYVGLFVAIFHFMAEMEKKAHSEGRSEGMEFQWRMLQMGGLIKDRSDPAWQAYYESEQFAPEEIKEIEALEAEREALAAETPAEPVGHEVIPHSLSTWRPPEPTWRERITNGIVATAIWSACVTVCAAAAFAFYALDDYLYDPLAYPPGWECRIKPCTPAPGFHLETDSPYRHARWPVTGLFSIHDHADRSVRMRDIDTATAWSALTREEKQSIYDSKATVYDYLPADDYSIR